MEKEELLLLSCSLRLFLITVTNITAMTYLMSNVLEKKHSYKGLGCYTVLKTLIQACLLGHILQQYFAGAEWLRTLQIIVSLVVAFGNYAIFYWTFQGEFLRIAIVAFLGEMIACFFGFISVAIINMLERRTDMWSFAGPLQLLDFGIPVITLGSVYIFCKLVHPYLKKIGMVPLRFQKLLWIVFCVFIVIASKSTIGSWETLSDPSKILLSLSIALILSVTLILWRYNKRIVAEQSFLELSKKLMLTHYEMVGEQVLQMEKSQKIIDQQMKQIVELQSQAEMNQKAKIYLQQLKREFEEIQAGMYCDDWLIDSILYTKSKEFARNGIELQCSVRLASRENVNEQELAQILLELLDIKKCRQGKVELEIAKVKNQLIIKKDGALVKMILMESPR